MCGIAGVYDLQGEASIDDGVLRPMLDTIQHRGPDSTKTHVEPGVGLGFCRLAIIDLAGGDQPLTNEDGSVWLVFNGEIYNYRSLRAQLIDRGHQFKTQSDSETIVHAYEEWGDACTDHLSGIFAFAIFDRRHRSMFFATDRTAIKPLYLSFQGSKVIFGSEVKAVLAEGSTPRGIDVLGFLGGEELDPRLRRTSFTDVHQLGAGMSLRVDGSGHTFRRYWRYEPSTQLGEPASEADLQEHVERFRQTLSETVESQLVADVPVAVALSGGLDSSAVAATVHQLGRDDVMTYTAFFDGDEARDLTFARQVVEALGVRNREIACPAADSTVSSFAEVAWLAEGDFDLGFVARHHLSKAVYADGAKVLLSGQGVDELLTGYDASYEAFHGRTLMRSLRSDIVPARAYPAFGEKVLEEARADLLQREGSTPGSSRFTEMIQHELRRDYSRIAYLLRFEDRMGMAGHVEVRVPFLDHALIELCAATPESVRAHLFCGKRLLRDAVADGLPESVARRPKERGFNSGSPRLTQVMAQTGVLGPPLPDAPPLSDEEQHLADLLSAQVVQEKAYFDSRYVAALRTRKDYATLDTVFVIHLLDELFAKDTQPDRFGTAA
ncbi:MAG: asparagine synthase (glutamine-hydrolyzing) [Acidobacteriota bacterium]